MQTTSKLLILGATLALTVSGCVVKTGTGTGSNTGPAPQDPPPAGSDGSGGDGGGVDVAPGCEFPENHCLPNDILMVAKKPYKQGHIYLHPSRQTGEAGAGGEATFLATNNGKELISKFYHVTRPAAANELQIGRLAIMIHRVEAGIYRAPRDTKEAIGRRWWMARITDISGIERGYVQVAGGYRISTDGIRLMDADKSPTASIAAGEDKHFLSADHWIVSNKGLPKGNYSYAAVGVAIKAPSAATKNEGEFIQVNNGKILWTPHAWRTRPATAAELKVGVYAFMPHRVRDKVYQSGKDRLENTTKRWWIAKIVDTSEAYKGVVQVAGGYKVSVDAIRVSY